MPHEQSHTFASAQAMWPWEMPRSTPRSTYPTGKLQPVGVGLYGASGHEAWRYCPRRACRKTCSPIAIEWISVPSNQHVQPHPLEVEFTS